MVENAKLIELKTKLQDLMKEVGSEEAEKLREAMKAGEDVTEEVKEKIDQMKAKLKEMEDIKIEIAKLEGKTSFFEKHRG